MPVHRRWLLEPPHSTIAKPAQPMAASAAVRARESEHGCVDGALAAMASPPNHGAATPATCQA
jgi:hypothetical protein